jgi:hypothetical protein
LVFLEIPNRGAPAGKKFKKFQSGCPHWKNGKGREKWFFWKSLTGVPPQVKLSLYTIEEDSHKNRE